MPCSPVTAPAAAGMKQWLLIGDSITGGVNGPVTKLAAAKGIQVVHIVGNGANVWWGSHCVDAWLTADPGRWDYITYQVRVLLPFISLWNSSPAHISVFL
jgi:hypothetical protein